MRGDLLKAVAERPDDADRHLALAFAEAGLGNKQEAIAQGRKAVEIMPVSRDAFAGPGYLTWQAKLYAQLGETDKAFEVIERLLGMPSGHSISGALLRIDPFWDPLRGDPRLEQLAARADSLIRDGSHG